MGESLPDLNNEQCQSWLERMASGDESAFSDFYQATLGKVYGLARRIVGDEQLAEDVVADVYYQVWQRAKDYDHNRGKVMTWVLTICRSRAIDCCRKVANEKDKVETASKDPSGVYAQQFALEAEDFESTGRVYQCLTELDPMQRQLIGMAFYRDWSHQQIADFTELPLGTVKSHIRRGLQKLKTLMARGEPA